MPVPVEILQLVDHFESNKRAYLNPHYNETSLRNEFLDPFFIALGWDVGNKRMYGDSYKEVVLETSQEVDGSARKPDYVFRAGGFQKFFVEAKKPSIAIETDPKPAFQVRRYAWSAKLPLSILTDFEEFAVYECRNKPAESDSPGTGRIELLHYTDYVKKWDWLYDTFSREAVYQGAYDRYAEGVKGKRGTQEVDDDFLKTIESWRDLLARDIARKNPTLSTPELNYAVQMTIDRIIFLRICEDREIEPDGQLQNAAASPNIYANLVSLFRQADERYNSGLFHFRAESKQSSTPDDLSLSLSIDDKALKEIISALYYPSPYVFREIPADILGQVYEKFLGKVIRLTPAHQARVEEKPEVRKAGGVYYTPTYIVDYIVKHTVGELVKDKTLAQVAALKILDPACGSGSFLLGAYQFLLNWHVDWYTQNSPEKYAKGSSAAVYPASGGGWRLTTAEKKRILLNNIHGVDIDPQAVEVTKLSLSLKVLEGESQQTIGAQLALFKERALPDLARNIQCGNSLIGWDYTEGRLFEDEEEKRRVNPFDWETAFPQVFKQGGFDAVIGNPPYIRIQAMREWAPNEVDYYKLAYQSAKKGNYDIYVIFVEKALSLLRKTGKLGFILPSKFFVTDYGESLRKIISERNALHKIVDFKHLQIFENATTYTCLLFLNPEGQNTFFVANVLSVPELNDPTYNEFPQNLKSSPWVFSDSIAQSLNKKIITSSITLKDLPARIGRGSSSGADPIFIIKRKNGIFENKYGEKFKSEKGIMRIPIFATDFTRFQFKANSEYAIIFPYHLKENAYVNYSEKELTDQFPNTYEYLVNNKKALLQRAQYKEWFGFSAARNLDIHEKAQILIPLLANKGSFCLLPTNPENYCLMASGGFSITIPEKSGYSPKYILGLINSKLLFWKLKSISNVFRGGWITCTKQYFETLPIHIIDFSKKSDIQVHDLIVNLVEKIISLYMKVTNTAHEKEALQREIAATDRQIDQLVYKLYGLTEDEIKIVEGS